MNIKNIVLAGIFFSLFLSLPAWRAGEVYAQEGQVYPSEQGPVVVAPGGLQEREIQDLQRQYRYDVRKKDLILEPAISTPYAEGPSISEITGAYMTEKEKLYRYFGIATVFHKLGDLEEAVEILEYILNKEPKDEYVRAYLRKVQGELREKKAGWKKTSKKDASLLKETETRRLKKEGIDFFKQKRYDKALLNFYDVLTLNPTDRIAQDYMRKLREYYMKEMRVENILQDLEQKETQVQGIGKETELEKTAAGLLDKFENKKLYQASENLLNKSDIKQLVVDTKAESLLDNIEQDYKIQEIISQRKEEERRSRSFILGEGDVLMISVRDHPELSGRAEIRTEGAIIMPLVNEAVMVAGLTPTEIQNKVVAALQRYVQDPIVYIGIEKFSSKIFYVIDETGATPFTITRTDFTLRDALFLSDWGSNRALGRVLVIRPDKLHPIVTKVDGFDLIYRGNLAKNIKIENGDVIYVPQTTAGKMTDTISDALSPVKQVKDLRSEWLEWKWNRRGWSRFFKNIPKNPAEQGDFNAPYAGGD